MSRKRDERAQAVLHAVYPRVAAEGLEEHGQRRWVRVPWTATLRPGVLFELRMGSTVLLRCEARPQFGWGVTRFARGDWDAELLAGLAA